MKRAIIIQMLIVGVVLFFITAKVTISAVNDNIILTLEEPSNGSIYSGVSNIRGWAVALHGINRIELYIDEVLKTNIPSGGQRKDVGDAYPSYPNADQSGFSMAFNYSELSAGQHTISIRAVDNNGDIREVGTTFNITRFENPFIADPAEVNLKGATLTSEKTTIQINNISVDSKNYDVHLDWRTATQGFAMTQITSLNNSEIQIKPGAWTGMLSGGFVCFNVSSDGSKLTKEGSQCRPGWSLLYDPMAIVVGTYRSDGGWATDSDIPIIDRSFLVKEHNYNFSGTFTSSTTASGTYDDGVHSWNASNPDDISITPGTWSGGAVCFNVSPDGSKLTKVGSHCSPPYHSLTCSLEYPASIDGITGSVCQLNDIVIVNNMFYNYDMIGTFTSSKMASGIYGDGARSWSVAPD